MLKLLLIGFTQANANVIQIFIEMTFKDIHVDTIVRATGEQSLNLAMLNEQQSDVFIIDFEGVGLDTQDKSIEQTLTKYTNGKPILFISRQPSMIVSLPNSEWLTTPYTRQQMNDSLTSLLEKINFYNFATNSPVTSQSQSAIANQQSKQTAPQNQNLENIENTASQEETKKIFDILADVFGKLHEQPFFDFTKKLQLSNDFLQVNINQYEIYFNPKDNSVITQNLERMADSFIIGLRKESIVYEILDKPSFQQKTAQLLAQGAKQYALSQLIWVVGLEIVQTKRDAYGETHQLKFEARYMPNIANVAPKYVTPLIASCLGRARGLSDFNSMFPHLTNAQINHVMILLTMSQVIRIETLLNSVKQSTSLLPKQTMMNHQSNQGVQKANKTGFLRRLLSKLGM